METKTEERASASDYDLASVRGPEVYEQVVDLQSMLDSGLLINVTAWATREMGFPKGRTRTTIAITARLWKVMHCIPLELTFFQTMRGRGHDILWLAAWMLRKAERMGQDYATFMIPLPTSLSEQDHKQIRAERTKEYDRPYVIVGLADEFPL